MSLLQNSNAIGAGGNYAISNSLRFQSASSQYLTRTPAGAGSQTIFTISAWVKRGALGVEQPITVCRTGASTQFTRLVFTSTDTLDFWDRNSSSATVARLTTTQVFRDPSAWYHVVLAVDTTQATAANRVRLYINGSEVTAFSTATYPSQNATLDFNTTATAWIGGETANPTYFDGYFAEYNFVNALQLTPSSFGVTDTSSGQWVAKKYTGTYGTNGFYLPFSNGTSTTTLGADSSGNSNNWTLTNFTRSAGVSDCWMTDVPSGNSGASGTQPASNYAIINPLSKGTSQTSVINGNLYAIPTSGASNWGSVFSSIAIPTSGKWYIEATATVYAGSGNSSSLGVVDSTTFIPTNTAILYQYTTGQGFDGILCQLFSDYVAPIAHGVQGTNVTGQTGTTINLMLALDVDNGKVYAGYNGTWLNSGAPASGTGYISSRTFSSNDVVAGHTTYTGTNDQAQNFNFGQRSFAYTPPTGFVALCTANLPVATIKQGNNYMDATLYTGNLIGQSITNAASFKPDLVWVKSRSAATDNKLTDSNRGATKALISNTTGAETTDVTGLTAFNANGFTVGASTTYNNTGASYVGWQWQAGQGSTSSNTSGSITSTVSVNASAGFSIVTYSGTGANATVGHGLGVAPKMLITKDRTGGGSWQVYHVSLGNTGGVYLNTTGAFASGSGWWNNTSPTSTTISIGTNGEINTNGRNYVAYCWAAIPGFSAFGSYTGNGSTDGPFIYLGFRPKYVMIKCTSIISHWTIEDSSRNPYNVATASLYSDTAAAELTSIMSLDLLSNGFKCRNVLANESNISGQTYIYMAFAENPFANSNAR